MPFTQDESGLPEGAVGYVNFADETYFFLDADHELEEVFGPDGWSNDSILPGDLVAGGWAPGSTQKYVGIIGDAFTTAIDGITIVADMTFAGACEFNFELVDSSDSDPDFICVMATAADGSSTVISPDGTSTIEMWDPEFMSEARHKCALTMIDGKLALSIDGGAAIQHLAAWSSPPDKCGVGFKSGAGAFLASIVFYPPQENAALPALSEL